MVEEGGGEGGGGGDIMILPKQRSGMSEVSPYPLYHEDGRWGVGGSGGGGGEIKES